MTNPTQKAAMSTKTQHITNKHFKMSLDPSKGCGEVYHLDSGKPSIRIARIRYLARLIEEVGGDTHDLDFVSCNRTQDDNLTTLSLAYERTGVIRVSVTIGSMDSDPGFNVEVVVENLANRKQTLGVRAFCLDIACDTIRARLVPGIYSGWTCEGRSLVIYPEFSPETPRQMGLVTDYERTGPMTMTATRQGCALNLPSVMRGGLATLNPDDRWTGAMTIRFGHDDIWDPALLKTAEQHCPPEMGIQTPSHSYDRHVDNWERFIAHDELWVPLGDDMGMFHRGFYGMIRFGEQRVSGALRYDGDLCIGTTNEKLVELSWGGSNNALLAYSLFSHGAKWAVDKAQQIINATCRFGDTGFLVPAGACAGAWHNGYYPELNQFADRYFRNTIYTPDQGIANYFLGKCLLEGFTKEASLAEMIARNCSEYLPRLENGSGGLVMARSLDGSPGVDRYGKIYDGDKADLAMPAALGAVSYLMDYRVNGNDTSRRKGERLLEHTLCAVETNEWRFHEYDTCGWDNMSMCWILTVLCEWAEQTPGARIEAAIEKTLQALFSCRFAVDFGIDRYSELERCWGGRMISRGGVVGGSTVGSMHGGDSLHNRFDAALAFWTHFRLTGDPRSYSALLEFLNYLTHHQWTREDLSIGLGAVSEAMHLDEGHIQDTAQVLHSNCLHHVLLNKQLFLESSTALVTAIRLPANASDTLTFSLRTDQPGPHHISIGGTHSASITLTHNGQTIHVGPGTGIDIELPPSNKEHMYEARVSN